MGLTRRRRGIAALIAAVALHVLALWTVQHSEVRRRWEPRPRVPIALVPAPPVLPPAPVPPPAPSAPSPAPAPSPHRAPPHPRPAPPASSSPVPPAEVATPPALPTPTAPPAAPPPSPSSTESVLRLPPGPSALDRVLGTGGPLGPSRGALEDALELRVDGPMSDAQAAARAAERALEHDLADDAVSVGLADDYFRTLRGRIEVAWKPAMEQLNDGGASTTQIGMMRSLVDDPAAWGEVWQAYLDLAKQYANGQPPTLEPARRERLRELMRSRRGAFRVHAIGEVMLTQDATGKILVLEMPLPSGHTGIDEGIRDAIAQAIAAMPEAPPRRLSHGRPFSSWWRLRATWTMVPPTALLTGASFDITSKGFAVDVPFDIKLTTHVMLQRTDARTNVEAESSDPG